MDKYLDWLRDVSQILLIGGNTTERETQYSKTYLFKYQLQFCNQLIKNSSGYFIINILQLCKKWKNLSNREESVF